MSPLLRDDLRLYLVTDEEENLLERTEAALRGGVTCVQLRMKNASPNHLLQMAKQCKQLCKTYHVPFIMNDNATTAKETQADALHIGQNDLTFQQARQIVGPTMPIGVSVQTVEQAIQAKKNGAAYIGVGAMFPTPSKQNALFVSLDLLEKIKSEVQIPIVAIGGINQHTIPTLLSYQLDGFALISAILSDKNPEKMARYFSQLLLYSTLEEK